MQIKGNDVINLKVMTIREGKYVEDVTDIIYDPKSHAVRALLVDEGGWLSDAKVIMFQDIKKIGKDAVMIESADFIKKAKDVSDRVSHIAKDDTYLTKTNIITEDGTDLGSVSDIYFDDKTGAVTEFEVSQGLMNMHSGKKRVNVSDIITIGKDATIVNVFTEQQFEEQGQDQGLQGMMNKTKEMTEETVQKVKELPDNPKVQSAIDRAKDRTSDLTSRAGQKIEHLKDTTKEKYVETKDSPKTQDRIDSVQNRAERLGEKIKEKTEEVRYSIKDNRKKEALGKYMKVNILTPQDQMVARRGDMITSETITRAERNGLLDKVLNNTSEKPV